MNPTTDPAASAALSRAIDETAREAGAVHVHRHARQTQPVTRQMFQALKRLTMRLGYTLGLDDRLRHRSNLDGITVGWPHLTVTLDESLTLEEGFSTLAHELSHIILGHNPRTWQEVEQRLRVTQHRDGIYSDPHEETACDLAAAAIMKVAGLGDGHHNADYIRDEMDGRPIPQHVKDAANLAARVLWAALNDEGTAYAYAA